MNTEPLRIGFLHRAPAALLIGLLLCAASARAQSAQLPAASGTPLSPLHTQPIRIENVTHIVGLDDKPGSTGDLNFEKEVMTFHGRGHSTAIPFHSIVAFSLAHDDRPLVSGKKGKLVEALPYGVGFAVGMTRTSVETLTLFYRDSDNAIHACVLALPKDTREEVISSLAGQLSPADYPSSGQLVSAGTKDLATIESAPASSAIKPSIEIALPSESVDGIPSAFPAALYEDLIEQLARSGLFAHVWRAGDTHGDPDSLLLHVDIGSWQKGSARGRHVTPFTGATKIKGSITLVDASGRTVFQGEANGAKHTTGENLEATNSLAKHVRKALEKAPALPWNQNQAR